MCFKIILTVLSFVIIIPSYVNNDRNIEVDVSKQLGEKSIIIDEIVDVIPDYSVPLSKELQNFIWSECNENNFEYEYILAIIYQESRFNSSCKSKNTDGTNDMGLCQINSGQTLDWLAKLTKINKPNRLNPYHSIRLCMARLKYARDYWNKKGIKDDEMFYYMTNSYNMGESGYKKYINKYRRLSRKYDQNITKYINQLKTKGEIIE